MKNNRNNFNGNNGNSFVWVPHFEGEIQNGIDVSSYGNEPFRQFSPFSYSKDYKIPIPGNEQEIGYSVEGIWQGLKVINGNTDFSLFKRKPHKRHGNVEAHIFENTLLNYFDARKQIYVPAYIFYTINNVLDKVKDELVSFDEPIVLYDVEANNDIEDLSKPYSHAALLVKLLNILKKSPLPPFSKHNFRNLEEQLNAMLDFRENLHEFNRDILDDVITFAYLFSKDELKETFALRAIKNGISDKGRLRKYLPNERTREIL